ncbi:MAG: sulfur carrier protein ThiS adenylyltransferase ThiF [Endomicrobia bacterium]|nr:sulfur carrier protein ThiS adenylyltransferase ThiF [Endomicrobiia bacterium]
MQTSDELENAITARNAAGIKEKLKAGKAAIAGLGGLGSNIAVMLARIGVGKLLLVDFDVVEQSNLNRQHYNLTHLGMLKTEALKSQIDKINSFVETEIRTAKVTEANALEIFKDYPIVCEAFDNPQYKAMLVNTLLEYGRKKIVAASGMAGYDSANKIKTKQTLKNLYICGDFEPAVQEGIGFMAPRVTICAGHQANMVLRLLLNIEKE